MLIKLNNWIIIKKINLKNQIIIFIFWIKYLNWIINKKYFCFYLKNILKNIIWIKKWIFIVILLNLWNFYKMKF